MEIRWTSVALEEYPILIQVWEASVRATHHFLRPGDVEFYKAQMPHYLSVVKLTAARDAEGRIVAFLGTHDGSIEMLFVAPSSRGMGIGGRLVRYAVRELGCTRVDVNEQNEQAAGFYERMGFRTKSRSAVDADGKPYPILHLIWSSVACVASEESLI